MTRFFYTLIPFFCLLSCQKKQQQKDFGSTSNTQHWSYNGETGPRHWNQIELNSDCGGKFQSPVNIVNYTLNTEAKPLDLQYAENTKIHDVTKQTNTTVNQNCANLLRQQFNGPTDGPPIIPGKDATRDHWCWEAVLEAALTKA